MAVIVNEPQTPEEFAAMLRAMDESALTAQQLCQRGALHAIETLIAQGCTPAMAEEMRQSLAGCLMQIHEVANERGIQLVSYQDDTVR